MTAKTKLDSADEESIDTAMRELIRQLLPKANTEQLREIVRELTGIQPKIVYTPTYPYGVRSPNTSPYPTTINLSSGTVSSGNYVDKYIADRMRSLKERRDGKAS